MKKTYLLLTFLICVFSQAQTVSPDFGFIGEKLNITIANEPNYYDTVSGTSSVKIFNDLNEQLTIESFNQVSDAQINLTVKIPNTATLGDYKIELLSYNYNQEYKEILKKSFTVFSSGERYTVSGKTTNCENNSETVPYLKFKISNGITTKTEISDKTGNFVLNLPKGKFTITPIFDKPEYSSATPASIDVDFPSTTGNSVLSDFCITTKYPNDLAVSAYPVSAARPGFDSYYQIFYTNNSNKIQSGSVELQFNEDLIDYVSSQPAFNVTEPHKLKWNFSDLKPFESRSINVVFNVNSPLETPEVNNGDILNFVATVSPDITDEIPDNNTFKLNQMVVNSFDPNDIICLEGAEISKEQVGDYLHYQIRFENTGTFAAEKIVVTNLINYSFDISTLTPVSSSHNYKTRITNNLVEFIFENINLPFDDANNDGYIIFKIKTSPNLYAGSSLYNIANIYFDFNKPIETNLAETKIVNTLSTDGFDLKKQFQIYPNPVNDILKIETNDNQSITSVEIFNFIGQSILNVPSVSNSQKIDVSQLPKGSYIVKINTLNGNNSYKFIKE